MKKDYEVKGMSCSACSARVESVVSKIDGVKSCSVNLLTNSMTVEGEVESEIIERAVSDAGYFATLKTEEKVKTEDSPTRALVKRLFSSLGFLIAIMYLSMGVVMLGAPFFTDSAVVIALLQAVLALVVIIINGKFYTSGIKGLIKGAPNMDTLVCIGSGASYIYSVVVTVLIIVDGESATYHLHGLYYESSAMILALITVGKTLESIAKGKTTSAIKALTALAPKTATVTIDGREKIIPLSALKSGDLFVVRAGGIMPCDGVIVDGGGAIDESAITGESVPVDKGVGDEVFSATVNASGYIVAKATRVGKDSTLGEIIKMVEGASATKAPIAKLADKVSGVFVPIVMAIAVITTTVWLLLGASVGNALSYGISVLVISCPCALGLATPVAIMVGSGVGAKKGVLFKSASALETAGRVKIVALDKTGTITLGKPTVTDIIPVDGTKEELLALAFALEEKSEHPLGRAITDYSRPYAVWTAENFAVVIGKGVRAKVNGIDARAGKLDYISEIASVSDETKREINDLLGSGKTAMVFALGGVVKGVIAVADTIKDDAVVAIERMKKAGLRVVMLTGDDARTANAVAKAVGIDEVKASLLPADKEREIRSLSKCGKTAMVGDGINDAVALASADIGVAIGAGAEVAVQSAEIVLTSSGLTGAETAFALGRKTLKNIRENLFWAFFYNCLSLPVASGVFASLGFSISPMLGAFMMSLSSFCVVTNALRLNLFRKEIKKEKTEKKENKNMTITLKIEGMMCPHCSGRVKSALEGIDGVKSAVVSHETGRAEIECENVTREVLMETVTKQGYKVIY